MELLCERVIASTGQPLRPGDALRRVFEAIAGGLLLPGMLCFYKTDQKFHQIQYQVNYFIVNQIQVEPHIWSH